MIYLIEQRHRIPASRHMNAPLRDEWRAIGRFEAHGPEEALQRAWLATHRAGACERDPLSNLRIAGIASRIGE